MRIHCKVFKLGYIECFLRNTCRSHSQLTSLSLSGRNDVSTSGFFLILRFLKAGDSIHDVEQVPLQLLT